MAIYYRQAKIAKDYYSAAICRRGHVESSAVEFRDEQIKKRCEKCGAMILVACPSCGTSIQGSMTGVIGGGYDAPEFCTSCGVPMPWASRQARLFELENILDEQDSLADAERLIIQEQIEVLSGSDVPEAEQARRWKTIKQVSPILIVAGKEIIVSVTTAAIQKQLGI